MKLSKSNLLDNNAFQVPNLQQVESLSSLPAENILAQTLLNSKKSGIKSEVMFNPTANCSITSSPSLVLESVSSPGDCSQLLHVSSDSQVMIVSDFLPSQVVLTDNHSLNSVPFNPAAFMNDNSTTVTWCNESVSPIAGSQTGLHSHLINGQKIVPNDRHETQLRSKNLNTSTFDYISNCGKTNENNTDQVGSKFNSVFDSFQPITLISSSSSPSYHNIVSRVNVNKSKSSSKTVRDRSVKRKLKGIDMKKNIYSMKIEAPNPDDCLSSVVTDSSVINLNHNTEILNSLLMNSDNLSSLFPNSTSLQAADLTNSIQIDLTNTSLNLDTFDTSKIDSKKYVFKTLDSTLIDPSNYDGNNAQSPSENPSKSKSNFSETIELDVYMDDSLNHADGNELLINANPENNEVISKNTWNLKLKEKESLTNDKTMFSSLSNSNSVLDPADNYLTTISMNNGTKTLNSTIDLFDGKIQPSTLNDSELKLKGADESEIGGIELGALHLSSSPPGYTAQLLSQLSQAHSLPSISSSQVSSVLSALEQNEKHPSGETTFSQALNEDETPIKNENMSEAFEDDIKVEDGIDDGMDSKSKTKNRPLQQNVQLVKCELNGFSCFKCGLCPYLSLSKETVVAHFHKHQSRLLKKAIHCIGCKNQFYSKFLLKAHLLQDHEVLVDELHPILDAIWAANKPQSISNKPQSILNKRKHRLVVTKEPELPLPQVNSVPTILSSKLPFSTSSAEVLISPQPSQEQFPQSISAFDPPLEAVLSSCEAPVNEPILNLEPSETVNKPVNVNSNENVERNSSETENTLKLEPMKTEEESENDKKKKKKTKVRPVAINKLLNQEKERTPAVSPVVSIPDLAQLKKKKLAFENGVKCGLEGCSARFSTAENLKFHQGYHDLENSTFKCLDCDHTNSEWSRFSVHLWRIHNIDIDLYSCAICNYKTSSRSQLLNLHYRIHGEERPFLCDLCGKGFKTTKQLRNHKAVHRLKSVSKAETKEIICSICGCKFADSRKLQLHENNIHKKLRPFLCNYCGHKASSRSSLRMHIRQHTGEKPFSCEECDYVTGDHNSLRRHKMRHSGAKRYSCPHCSYACIQSNTYKSHLKRKHPGLDEGLMFSCHLCSFKSIKKENLMSHITEHKENENEKEGKNNQTDKERALPTSEPAKSSEEEVNFKVPVISQVRSLNSNFGLENATVIDILPSDQTLALQNLAKQVSSSMLPGNSLECIMADPNVVIEVKNPVSTNGFTEPAIIYL